jgi:hypothetical protein
MLDARERAAWDRAAQLLTLLANAHYGTQTNPSPYQLANFHPYLKKHLKKQPTGLSITPATIDRLKVFLEHR